MSLLTDFHKLVAPLGLAIIGTSGLSISGGAVIQGVLSEAQYRREYSEGYEVEETFDIVVQTSDFTSAYPLNPQEYQGKIAVIDSNQWRIAGIGSGGTFTKIMLISIEEPS